MFEYEQETYGSKGRERIRAAAMAHTGKKGKVLLPPTRRQKAEGRAPGRSGVHREPESRA